MEMSHPMPGVRHLEPASRTFPGFSRDLPPGWFSAHDNHPHLTMVEAIGDPIDLAMPPTGKHRLQNAQRIAVPHQHPPVELPAGGPQQIHQPPHPPVNHGDRFPTTPGDVIDVSSGGHRKRHQFGCWPALQFPQGLLGQQFGDPDIDPQPGSYRLGRLPSPQRIRTEHLATRA